MNDQTILKRKSGLMTANMNGSSVMMDIATGKYYYDLEVKDVSTSVDDGVRVFFTGALGGR
jgi:hypothetical protein